MSEDNNTVVTLKVRVTPEFREKLIETAKSNNRSMNAEIVHRLEQSFTTEDNPLLLGVSKGTGKSKTSLIASTQVEYLENAAAALDRVPAQELLNILFKKMNANGLSLTVKEIERSDVLKEKSTDIVDNKAP